MPPKIDLQHAESLLKIINYTVDYIQLECRINKFFIFVSCFLTADTIGFTEDVTIRHCN